MRRAALMIASMILILIGAARAVAAIVVLIREGVAGSRLVPMAVGLLVVQLGLCLCAVLGGVGLLLGRRGALVLASMFMIAFPLGGMLNGWVLMGAVPMGDVAFNIALLVIVGLLLAASRFSARPRQRL